MSDPKAIADDLRAAIDRLRGYVDNGGLIHTASAYRTSDGRVHLIEFDDLRAVLDAAAQRDDLAAVVQAAYNAWHMETRERAIEILHAALSDAPTDALAEHDRQVAEKAWDACAQRAENMGRLDDGGLRWLRKSNPYRKESRP